MKIFSTKRIVVARICEIVSAGQSVLAERGLGNMHELPRPAHYQGPDTGDGGDQGLDIGVRGDHPS